MIVNLKSIFAGDILKRSGFAIHTKHWTCSVLGVGLFDILCVQNSMHHASTRLICDGWFITLGQTNSEKQPWATSSTPEAYMEILLEQRDFRESCRSLKEYSVNIMFEIYDYFSLCLGLGSPSMNQTKAHKARHTAMVTKISWDLWNPWREGFIDAGLW